MIVTLIILFAAIIIIIYALAFGFGALLGIVSLFTHPIGGRAKPAGPDAYALSRPKLSRRDARYQTREYKPPRG